VKVPPVSTAMRIGGGDRRAMRASREKHEAKAERK
jgi:hypothetical protein